ncbi:MAG TPA: AAA family ATPase [Clostridia bacterium]
MSSDWSFTYCPVAPGYRIDWDNIYNNFSWVRLMDGIQQNPSYHAEGDVLTHTKLVCEALIDMKEWQDLDETERSVLFLAALFHDAAKPYCTRIDPEGISSPGHAVKGELISRKIIYKDLKIPFTIRETIAKLVRFHGLPLFFIDKPDPAKAVIEASQMIRLDLLYILSKADVLGRECPDKNELLDRIFLFSEFCRENRCFEESRKFASNFSRFVYFQKENGFPDYEAYDDTQSGVILMSGLPAAGKDTWIEKNYPDHFVVSLDDIRDEIGVSPEDGQGEVIWAAREQAKTFLRQHKSFIWNATNLTSSLRRQLVNLFVSYGAKVKIVYLEIPYKEILRRNSERSRNVPEKIIEKMISKLEVPNVTEAHEVKWIVE